MPDTINALDPVTGMSELHIAVGTNQFDRVRTLVASGARFFPDREGRWPSTIAAICEVDEDLMDFVLECEERQEDRLGEHFWETVNRLAEPPQEDVWRDDQDDTPDRRRKNE